MGIALRPLDKSDIPELTRLYVEAEAVDHTGEHYNEADLEEEFDNPDIDLGKDIIGAFDGDDLVGYYSVMARTSDEDRKVYVFGITHPTRRGEGIGTLLAEGMLARAADIQQEHGKPVRALLSGLSTNQGLAGLAGHIGLEPDRWSFTMRTMLDGVSAAPDFASGYVVRRYQEGDSDRWLAAHNVAFRDHPNFAVWGPSEWQHWVTGSRSFRPEHSFFVTPEGEPNTIAAYVQTNEYDAFTEVTGRREAYVAKVGTMPEHRGKGLATTLLQHCLSGYQEAGYDEASLDVDSMNPTGALGIYERVGFSLERTFVTYARVLTSPA